MGKLWVVVGERGQRPPSARRRRQEWRSGSNPRAPKDPPQEKTHVSHTYTRALSHTRFASSVGRRIRRSPRAPSPSPRAAREQGPRNTAQVSSRSSREIECGGRGWDPPSEAEAEEASAGSGRKRADEGRAACGGGTARRPLDSRPRTLSLGPAADGHAFE